MDSDGGFWSEEKTPTNNYGNRETSLYTFCRAVISYSSYKRRLIIYAWYQWLYVGTSTRPSSILYSFSRSSRATWNVWTADRIWISLLHSVSLRSAWNVLHPLCPHLKSYWLGLTVQIRKHLWSLNWPQVNQPIHWYLLAWPHSCRLNWTSSRVGYFLGFTRNHQNMGVLTLAWLWFVRGWFIKWSFWKLEIYVWGVLSTQDHAIQGISNNVTILWIIFFWALGRCDMFKTHLISDNFVEVQTKIKTLDPGFGRYFEISKYVIL